MTRIRRDKLVSFAQTETKPKKMFVCLFFRRGLNCTKMWLWLFPDRSTYQSMDASICKKESPRTVVAKLTKSNTGESLYRFSAQTRRTGPTHNEPFLNPTLSFFFWPKICGIAASECCCKIGEIRYQIHLQVISYETPPCQILCQLEVTPLGVLNRIFQLCRCATSDPHGLLCWCSVGEQNIDGPCKLHNYTAQKK